MLIGVQATPGVPKSVRFRYFYALKLFIFVILHVSVVPCSGRGSVMPGS